VKTKKNMTALTSRLTTCALSRSPKLSGKGDAQHVKQRQVDDNNYRRPAGGALPVKALEHLVAPLDAAGVDPGGDLVVYRAREGTEFLRRDALAVLLAEQDDLVPDLNPIVNPKDRSVHGNPSEEGPPLARDQGLGPTRERPPIPLRVPNRHRRRERRCLRPERQPVGDPVPLAASRRTPAT
jgi:hypothetical protein